MGERGGIPLLPKALLAAIAVLGLAALCAGLYVEQQDPAWLSAHPFTTNLISSVVGFCTVTFVVGVGFAALAERAANQRLENRLTMDAARLVLASRKVSWVVLR